MIYAELIKYLSLSLTEKYLAVIEPFYTEYLNASLSNSDYEDSCEEFLEVCKCYSFVNYSSAELQKIKESDSISELEEKLVIKLMSGSIEGILQRFNDKELLTLTSLLHDGKKPAAIAISKVTKSKTRDIYRPCNVCGYKTHIEDDYSIYCSICTWDLEMRGADGRFKFNLNINGNEMTMEEGRDYFKKYGIAKAGVISDFTILQRWLYDLANNNTSVANFFEYLDVWLVNHSKQIKV